MEIVDNAKCEKQTERLSRLTHGTAFCAGNITRSAACRGKKRQSSPLSESLHFPFAGDLGGALFLLDDHDEFSYKAMGIVSSNLVDSIALPSERVKPRPDRLVKG